MTLYTYESTSTTKTTTIDSGQPNGSDTAVIAGTRTVTVVGLVGELISRITYDIASGAITASESVNPANYDVQKRPTRIDYLDGTFELFSYGCCGLQSHTDRNGMATTYTYMYDDLKRKLSEIRLGISTLFTYDAAGRVTMVKRKGTDNSEITQRTVTYDLAGRITQETDALGVLTTYADAYNAGTGETTKTTTYASGASRHC